MWLYLLLGVCASVCLHSVIGLVSFIRFLPALLSLVRYLTRWTLVLSFRLYRFGLAWLAPYAKRYFKIELLTGWVRLSACTVVSLLLAIGLLVLLQLPINLWLMAMALGHGLLVGVLWEDLSQPGELHLGIKLL